MMEEANDEQPEMVSHEEAVLAEKEATENLSLSLTGFPSSYSPLPVTLAAPSPLPAFLGKSLTSQIASPSPAPSVSRVSSSSQELPSFAKAPESPQIPHEGQVKVPEPGGGQQLAASLSSAGQGLFSWISGNSLVNRVVEKTKSSMETVITTLDPGMREVIYSGGDINIVVTSTKDSKVVPVRDAFQKVFGKATVSGKECQVTVAVQPVGFMAGVKGAEERISSLRKSGNIPHDLTVISIEGFIVEIVPDRWFEMSCLLLKDPRHDIELQTFSQPSLIPTEYVLTAQDKTPSDYPLRWSGLAVTIGEVIETAQPHIGHADWHMVLTGVSRCQSLQLALQSLAYMYKQKLPTSFIS
ncbi:unnamed protein product [Candidula unifasciata]|uniref:Non-canonical purine NTP phosphatase/PRRC1 domain-containing protein n=1 Tax=Candidula unifasciata TaxID=100452 RepID=A0A8S3Z812_9EUPU|nr:unnamed protein product [Candidula unifasciata]